MLVRSPFQRESPDVDQDPVSDLIQLADVRSAVPGAVTLGRSWAVRFPPLGKIRFFAMAHGECRLSWDDGSVTITIGVGDVFLPSPRLAFVLAGGPEVNPIDARTLFADHPAAVTQVGEGACGQLIGGHVHLNALGLALIPDLLPHLIHVRAGSPQAGTLRWLIDRLNAERAEQLPGAPVASAQLAQLVFIQLLRVSLALPDHLPAGLLRALGDARIAPALRAMHADPGRPWTLGELARAAAMSRTSFAQHFKDAAGVAPLSYLRRWRMLSAEQRLRDGKAPVSVVARALGYESESAFSYAFKRVTGRAPRQARTGTLPS